MGRFIASPRTGTEDDALSRTDDDLLDSLDDGTITLDGADENYERSSEHCYVFLLYVGVIPPSRLDHPTVPFFDFKARTVTGVVRREKGPHAPARRNAIIAATDLAQVEHNVSRAMRRK